MSVQAPVQPPAQFDSSLNNIDTHLDSTGVAQNNADTYPTSSVPQSNHVPCQICRLQTSTITYFNVVVCSGCRAFFRRSVKNAKKYCCLNSRLCGKEQLVPNRRVCKYCRFNRCIEAGMLDAKVKLQNKILESVTVQLNNPTGTNPSLPNDPKVKSSGDPETYEERNGSLLTPKRIVSRRVKIYFHREQ